MSELYDLNDQSLEFEEEFNEEERVYRYPGYGYLRPWYPIPFPQPYPYPYPVYPYPFYPYPYSPYRPFPYPPYPVY
jgi:hypothetical protein